MGAAQMLVAKPAGRLPAERPEAYFISVTAHGTLMAYVLPTLFTMGFGYFVATTALDRPLPSLKAAWVGFWIAAVGIVMAAVPIFLGKATVLYTFYPPLTGSVFYYLGLVLVVVGSWIWVALMIWAMTAWKRENPGRPVPLAMFATVANAVLWLWTTVGVGAELLFQVIPAALGLEGNDRCRPSAHVVLVDVARDRLFLADSRLHRLLYDAAAGRGRAALQRHDGAAQLHPVPALQAAGRHASPVHGSRARHGLQVPADDADRARHGADAAHDIHDQPPRSRSPGRLRGGTGLFGWISKLPWEQPMVLAPASPSSCWASAASAASSTCRTA